MDPVKTATGGLEPPPRPKFLVLDSHQLDAKEETTALREYIKLDRVEFVIEPWPPTSADVPLVEECRALCDLEDFDIMYDLTMQYLAKRNLQINMRNNDGSKTELGCMYVKDKFADLRFMQCVTDSAWLVNWLVEFMAGYLSKKFPLPMSQLASKAAKKDRASKKRTTI